MSPDINNLNPNYPHQGMPVSGPGSTISSGNVRPGVPVQHAPDMPGANESATTIPKSIIETIVRRMTVRDVINQLLQMGVQASEENRNIAVKMLKYGIELSKENIAKILTMLKGVTTNATNQEAAIIALSKGLENQPTIIKLIAQFLQDNPGLANQIMKYLTNMSQLQALLSQSGQTLISPQLASQLVSIMASLNESFVSLELKNINKKALSPTELLNNFRAMKSLLGGITAQAASQAHTPQGQQAFALIRELRAQLQNMIESLTANAILSRPNERTDSAMPDKFAYWQIPMTLGNPPKDLEILVRRDPKKKDKINPHKTRIVLKMETQELGELAVDLEVDGSNVECKFNTMSEEVKEIINKHMKELEKRFTAKNYKTKMIQVVKKNLDIKKLLLPTIDLDNLIRVQTEA